MRTVWAARPAVGWGTAGRLPTISGGDAREQSAGECEAAAEGLEVAARHLRATAGHFRAGVVPRACAHLVAAEGELVRVRRQLDGVAERHAERAEA